MSGWGDTDPSSDRVFHFANQLQSGNVSLHDFDDCAQKYAKSKHLKLFEEKVHLCAYDEKVDAFIGDSGGPLVCFDVRIIFIFDLRSTNTLATGLQTHFKIDSF